ncbi:MAG: hypothetical protein ACE5FL_11565 [Myxococcota bacterium]
MIFTGKTAIAWGGAAVCLLLVAWLYLRLAEVPPPTNSESNDIEFVVDGALRRTWTVAELMAGRFDWESPKEQVYPVVPVSFVVYEESGLPRASVASVKLISHKGELEFAGENLALVDELLLKLDIARSGTWALVSRSRDAERRLAALLGTTRFKKVIRIEVSLRRDPRAFRPADPEWTLALGRVSHEH